MAIRTLVVDDEPAARRKLQRLLLEHPDFDVVAEAGTPREAARLIRRLKPDLVFLDVVMPGGQGFEALDGLGREELPRIVFVTAFDTYAVRAFQVHAIDYLLKPFDRRRFGETLRRVRGSIADATARGRLEQLLRERRGADSNAAPQASSPTDRLLVRDGEKMILISFRSIDRVEAEGNYLRVHVGPRSYLVRETMKSLAARLPDQQFLRLHRSHLVNLDRVVEILPMFRGDAEVRLVDDTRLPLSRRYRTALRRFEP